MAISRRAMDGSVHESEPINKSQIYITTAGYKSTYAYERLIDLLVRSVLRPNNAIILGGTWRIPVATGLQSKNFINDAKEGGTFNEASFDREYKIDLYSLNIINCWKILFLRQSAAKLLFI